MQTKFKYFLTIFLVVLLCAPFFSVLAAKDGKELLVSPKVLNIGAFFSGGELTISGDIKKTEDILIEVRGRESECSFDLKGRVGGLWMTVGNVRFENTPELYQLLTPEGAQWIGKAENIGLGINPLKNSLKTEGNIDIPENIFSMFSNLKKKEGLFKEVTGVVKYSDETESMKHFTAVCMLPDKIKTGPYEIRAVTVSDGIVKSRLKSGFIVKEVGFVKLVNNLVYNHSLVYGIAAVCIAILAGLLMGFIFKQDGGAH